jgi:hypothetical protein
LRGGRASGDGAGCFPSGVGATDLVSCQEDNQRQGVADAEEDREQKCRLGGDVATIVLGATMSAGDLSFTVDIIGGVRSWGIIVTCGFGGGRGSTHAVIRRG